MMRNAVNSFFAASVEKFSSEEIGLLIEAITRPAAAYMSEMKESE